MFLSFFQKFRKDIVIDLGTANTRIYVPERGIVVNEPSVVAFNIRTDRVLAVGDDAKRMVGKTPSYITATSPLIRGVISDYELTEKMLRHFLDKIDTGSIFNITPRSRMIFGVPLEITEVERKAVEDVAMGAGAREVLLVQQAMASAIGLRLPIKDAVGNMVVNLGAGTTEIAVISLGGVVSWKFMPTVGNQLNNDISEFARHEYNILLGESASEMLKVHIGTAIAPSDDLEMKVRGRDLISGLPKEVVFNDYQVRTAIHRSLRLISEDIKVVLEMTPPELVADIYEYGIVLTGGGALLKGIDVFIQNALQIPVRIADDPTTTVVRGLGLVLEDKTIASEVTLPSTQSASPLR